MRVGPRWSFCDAVGPADGRALRGLACRVPVDARKDVDLMGLATTVAQVAGADSAL